MIGLFEASVVVALAVLWFGVPLTGSLLVLYSGILLFLLAAVGVGLMISALALTLQQALLGAFLFMVPAVLLSGFAELRHPDTPRLPPAEDLDSPA